MLRSCYVAFCTLRKISFGIFAIFLHDDLLQRYVGFLFEKILFLKTKNTFMFYDFEEKYLEKQQFSSFQF